MSSRPEYRETLSQKHSEGAGTRLGVMQVATELLSSPTVITDLDRLGVVYTGGSTTLAAEEGSLHPPLLALTGNAVCFLEKALTWVWLLSRCYYPPSKWFTISF